VGEGNPPNTPLIFESQPESASGLALQAITSAQFGQMCLEGGDKTSFKIFAYS
jgi:hypothetical protein